MPARTAPEAPETSLAQTAPRRRLLVRSMRPRQWAKNLAVLAPVVFAERLLDPDAVWRSAAAFAVFCALSGAVYLLNDLRDEERDRAHPVKRARPLASGELKRETALAAAFALALASVAASFALRPAFGFYALGFFGLQVAYSFALKDIALLDVLAISAGFVLRATAGIAAIEAPGSAWLVACAGLLALFLGLAKRRHELASLGRGGVFHRPALAAYARLPLDLVIDAVVAATIAVYSWFAWSFDSGAHPAFMPVSSLFVAFGLLRYLHLMKTRDAGGAPEEVLLADRPLLAGILLWCASVLLVMY